MNAVFFFKQKTAYEMRISDWSSDVCSSDLAEPVLLHHDARQPESVGEGGDLPAELIGLGLRCYGVLDEPGEPVQIAPVVLADEDGGDHAAVAALGGPVGRIPPAARRDQPLAVEAQLQPAARLARLDLLAVDHQPVRIEPARLGARSEEHTSELQSLMRNSYA